jgi:hypothetical protein
MSRTSSAAKEKTYAHKCTLEHQMQDDEVEKKFLTAPIFR